MKYLVSLIIVLFLSSCAIEGMKEETMSTLDEEKEPFIIKVILKRQDYNYKPWTYVDEYRCGYIKDEWASQINDTNICVYDCVLTHTYGYGNIPVFDTIEECKK